MRRRRADGGQASVELVALLPLLLLVALAMAQGAVAGWAAWSASGAARAGARAEALGAPARDAALRGLPAALTRAAVVDRASPTGAAAGRVTVRLRVPSLLPGVRFGRVSAQAQVPGQRA